MQSSQRPYVSCSFGKDSAVLLHLCLIQQPDIPVRFLRWEGETDCLGDYDRVVAEWQSRHPALARSLHQVELSRQSMEERTAERWEALRQGLEPDTALLDTVFLGLRAEESKGRRMTLRSLGPDAILKDGLRRVCPLAWWRTDDIAACTALNQLPLLDAYAQEGFETRTTSRVPRAAHGIRGESLARLRQRDPNGYNQLLARFPELGEWA